MKKKTHKKYKYIVRTKIKILSKIDARSSPGLFFLHTYILEDKTINVALHIQATHCLG